MGYVMDSIARKDLVGVLITSHQFYKQIESENLILFTFKIHIEKIIFNY